MKTTINYGLKKPEGTDVVNIEDLNYNADVIDQKIKEVDTKASNIKVPVTSVNGKSGAVTLAASDVGAVPTGRKVNNKPLSADIALSASDIKTSSGATVESQLAQIKTDIGNKTTLKTTDKTSLVSAVNELFTNANNGKQNWVDVIGSPLANTDTFATLKSKTQTLKNTMATNLTNKGQSSSGTETLNSLINKITNINTGKRWASGTSPLVTSWYEDSPGSGRNSCLVVKDLNFKPSIVIAKEVDYGTLNFCVGDDNPLHKYRFQLAYRYERYDGEKADFSDNYFLDRDLKGLYMGGIDIYFAYTSNKQDINVKWIAIE